MTIPARFYYHWTIKKWQNSMIGETGSRDLQTGYFGEMGEFREILWDRYWRRCRLRSKSEPSEISGRNTNHAIQPHGKKRITAQQTKKGDLFLRSASSIHHRAVNKKTEAKRAKTKTKTIKCNTSSMEKFYRDLRFLLDTKGDLFCIGGVKEKGGSVSTIATVNFKRAV